VSDQELLVDIDFVAAARELPRCRGAHHACSDYRDPRHGGER